MSDCDRLQSAAQHHGEPDTKLKPHFCWCFTEEEEEFLSVLRDRSHIDETLRLATEEKAGDYAGKKEDLIAL